MHVGFIGCGELARHFAPRIIQSGGAVTACVPEHPGSRPVIPIEGVVHTGDLADLSSCEWVFSLVTATVAHAVAADYRAHATPGQIYADFNSTGPESKRMIAEVFEGQSVRVVDVAVVGRGVTLDGYDVPLLVSGDDSSSAADDLRAVGLNARAIAGEVGASASLKMLRGVVIKGMAATLIEAVLAARQLGAEDELLESVAHAIGSGDVGDFLRMLLETHDVHHVRRVAEAGEVARFVEALGVEAVMARAMERGLARVPSAALVQRATE